MKKRVLAASPLFALALLSSCTVTAKIPLSYEARIFSDLQRVAPKSVYVHAVDRRPMQEREVIKGNRVAEFVFEQPPARTLEDALRAGLEANGFEVTHDANALRDLDLEVELERFFYMTTSPGMKIIKHATLQGSATVSGTGGSGDQRTIRINSTYEKEYNVGASGWPTEALNQVLKDAIDQLLVDPRFLEALGAR